MTTHPEYEALVQAWAAQLRAGSSLTWTEFRAAGSPVGSPAGSAVLPPVVPSAVSLELVRRLAGRGIVGFESLADLVLTTSLPGRGLTDVPLTWDEDAATFGPTPVEPDLLPADELVRACCGVLVRLLAGAEVNQNPPVRARQLPWQRGLVVLGAPTTVALARATFGARSGWRPMYVVVGHSVEELMAQRWAARVSAGAAIRWPRLWRRAEARDRFPPGVRLADLAGRLAQKVGSDRVHVVLADDPAAAVAVIAEVLGVRLASLVRPAPTRGPLATDLLRTLNPFLALAVGEETRRRIVEQVWPALVDADASDEVRLGAPDARVAWARAAGERMAAGLRAGAAQGRYAVHGDPELVVPKQDADVVRQLDPEQVLLLALDVVARAWARTQGRTEGRP